MNFFLSIKYVKSSFTLIKVIISTDLFEFDCIHFFQYPTYARSNLFCLLLVFVTVAILANYIVVIACTSYIWSYYEFYKIIKMFVNVALNNHVKVFVINVCQTSSVNFTNVLHAHFSYKILAPKIPKPNIIREKLLNLLSYKHT